MDGSTGNLLTEKNIMTEPMFIREYTIDGSVCDQIIEYYEGRTDKRRGETWARDYDGDTYVPTEDPTVKLCTTAPMPSSYEASPQCIKDYFSELQKVLVNYVEEYPECNSGSPWAVLEPPSIQHYAPGEGYYGWHTERSSAEQPLCARHLVYMTYLNDVYEGGGTEWMHQKYISVARKGKTIIWPSDWTHTHRGVVAPKEDKYIITGWFSYEF
tara:strand:- start:767 stop:1405 length:639 start_codon:yes stop_codon:yes gene_type:complete